MRRARRAATTGRLCAGLALLCGTALAGLAQQQWTAGVAAEDVPARVPGSLHARIAPRPAQLPLFAPEGRLSCGARIEVPIAREPEALVASTLEDSAEPTAASAARTSRCSGGYSCGVRVRSRTLAEDVSGVITDEFSAVVAAAPRPIVIHNELTTILMGVAREIEADRAAASPAASRRETDTGDMTIGQLRQWVPDGVVRRLGWDLPALMLERDLAPEVRGLAGGVADNPSANVITLWNSAVVGGELHFVSCTRMSGPDDPRIAAAQAEAARRLAEYHRSVEAIVGLRVFPRE